MTDDRPSPPPSHQNPDLPPSNPSLQVVSSLRAARERHGVHLASLAAKLKIPVARLQALEEGRFEEFSDPVFVRTLALSVCRQLRVDPAAILAELPAGGDSSLERLGGGLKTPFRERPGRMEPALKLLPNRGIVIGLLAVALASVAWFALKRATVTVGSESTPPVAASAVPSVSSQAAPTIETVFAGAAEDAFSGAVITASEASWVEVLDGQGAVVLSRIVQPGESLKVSAESPLRLKIGNAKATQVRFKGQSVDLTGNTRDNVARLDLN